MPRTVLDIDAIEINFINIIKTSNCMGKNQRIRQEKSKKRKEPEEKTFV